MSSFINQTNLSKENPNNHHPNMIMKQKSYTLHSLSISTIAASKMIFVGRVSKCLFANSPDAVCGQGFITDFA